MTKHRAILYKVVKYPLSLIFTIMYWPKVIDRKNMPKKGAVIFASNHIHFMDGPALVYSTRRTVFFLAKDTIFKGWFKNWFFRSAGAIPVNRREKDEECKNQALEVLEQGKVIGIFPEGTRNTTYEVTMPFKFGAVSFAKKSGAKIVPVAITGKYRIFRSGIKIRLGEPIDISGMELEEANNVLRETINKMILWDEKKK